MKISVMTNGMVKVEGSTLAEEVEMRNKLQAQGKTCTPIEYEGSVQDCLDWIMGKSESELDEVEDDDDLDEYDDDYEDEEDEDEDEDVYVLTDEDGQELEIEIADVCEYISDRVTSPAGLLYDDVKSLVKVYLGQRPEINENDRFYLASTGQLETLTDKVYDCL